MQFPSYRIYPPLWRFTLCPFICVFVVCPIDLFVLGIFDIHRHQFKGTRTGAILTGVLWLANIESSSALKLPIGSTITEKILWPWENSPNFNWTISAGHPKGHFASPPLLAHVWNHKKLNTYLTPSLSGQDRKYSLGTVSPEISAPLSPG